MTVITGKYDGNLRTTIRHEDSGAEIETSAPKDNNGDGLLFSPTDLVGAALGSCIVTTIAIVAGKKRLDVSGMYFRVEKHMSTDPRRIGKLPVAIHMPKHLGEKDRESLEKYGRQCPVHHSLHPEIDSEISFVYDV